MGKPWRRVHIDHEGGAAVISKVGRRDFIRFPNCHNLPDPTAHMDRWFEEYQEHGPGVPADVLYEMVLDTPLMVSPEKSVKTIA